MGLDIRMKELKSIMSIIFLCANMLIIAYGNSYAATSTDVRIISTVTEPVCHIDVPAVVDLGETSNASGSEFVRSPVTIKIQCDSGYSVTNWLTAYAYDRNNEFFANMRNSDGELTEVLYLDVVGGSRITFDGFTPFCSGNTDRECKLTPKTLNITSYAGEGKAKITFFLEYN